MTRDEQGRFRNRGRVGKGIYAPVVLVLMSIEEEDISSPSENSMK